MPDPFRHYDGVPVLDLPADPPAPDSASPAQDGAAFLSRLLFYSASISAWKRAPSGVRYALRVNPSSGNLHPTEFHFVTRGLKDWPDGLYHYRPLSHMAEQRALGDFFSKLPGLAAPVTFILTAVVWREAWKYRERAYRYCLLDIGHASEALLLAAQAMGLTSTVTGEFADDELARGFGFSKDEWPMLVVALSGAPIPAGDAGSAEAAWFGGEANRLSRETISYSLIEGVHQATKWNGEYGETQLPRRPILIRDFGKIARARRSALDFLATAEMSFSQLSAILGVTESCFVQMYLYVHRVEGLPAGVYRYAAEACELERINVGDQHVMAAGLSLGQELAGNACLAFSMVADLERAARACGECGYRYVHFEAGATGQRMYLAAEALGMRATGIGAFFDDEVNRYLELTPAQGEVIYHFAIGHAITDGRLEA